MSSPSAIHPCAGTLPPRAGVAIGSTLPMPALGDPEGERVPEGMPPLVDAHVHLFPDRLFAAIWRWFHQHGWPIRYELRTPQAIEFLLSRGVEQIVAIHYAHKPGLARMMNAYLAEVCRAHPRVLGLATVFPGEPGARALLEEAFAMGLRGVKLHCHVQCFSPDSPELHEVYTLLCERSLPLVIHAGREPKSEAYRCDPYRLCAAERVEHVLRAYPTLKVCVPHLGADEFDAYERLLGRYDNLWLDTTMVIADYFATRPHRRLLETRPERLMYGTDFPNLPYAWDREARRLAEYRFPDHVLVRIAGETAREFFELPSGPDPRQ